MLLLLSWFFISFAGVVNAAVFPLTPTTTGFCFVEQRVCFRENEEGVLVGPAPVLRTFGDPGTFLGDISLHDCVCRGGQSFHWIGSTSHTDCGSDFVFTDIVNDAGEITAINLNVGFIQTPPRADRRLAATPQQPTEGTNQQMIRSLSGAEPFDIVLPVCSSSIVGEPHIKKWTGEWYDWQGECDAVFLHAPDFCSGLGMRIHTRTKIRYDYSFIEAMALLIGTDILEISSFGAYMFSGISQVDLPQKLADCCEVSHTEISEKEHEFVIALGGGHVIEVSTFKDIVSIKIIHGTGPEVLDWFGNSTGLMGSFQSGKLLARDGKTVLDEPNALGQEWQVLDSEPKLFHNMKRMPQYPDQCRLPPKGASKQGNLRPGVTREAAEKACANWSDEEREGCILDVLATKDLELAQAGRY